MKKQYIKPEIWILDSDDSMILCTSLYQDAEEVYGHDGARGGGFFEDEYEDADDDYGW